MKYSQMLRLVFFTVSGFTVSAVFMHESKAAGLFTVRGTVTQLSEKEVVLTTRSGKKIHWIRSRLTPEMGARVSATQAQLRSDTYSFPNSVLKKCTLSAMCER